MIILGFLVGRPPIPVLEGSGRTFVYNRRFDRATNVLGIRANREVCAVKDLESQWRRPSGPGLGFRSVPAGRVARDWRRVPHEPQSPSAEMSRVQRQVCDVQASDQQNKSSGSKQQQQGRTNVSYEAFIHGNHARPRAELVCGYSCSGRWYSISISDCPWSRVTPGLSRV